MRAVVAGMGLGLLLWAGCARFVDLDVWHLMALVRAALARGAMPTEDLFAYTPTVAPVVQHEWGTGAILYVVGRVGGLTGLQLLRLLLVTIAAWATIRTARLRGATGPSLVLLAPLAVVMSWIGLTAVRPQLFTMTALALLLWGLERDRRGQALSVGLWSVGFVVWANLHAGFVVGLVFVLVHGAEQWLRGARVRHLAALLAVVAAGIAINPYGLSYYAYLVHALTMDRPFITEWRPLWDAHPVAIGVVAAALLVAGWATLRCGLRALPGWVVLALTACAAIRHERHVSLFAIAWMAYVPAAIAQTPLGRRIARFHDRPLGWAIAGTLLVCGVAGSAAWHPWELSVPADAAHPHAYPVGAVAYLRDEAVAGNVMTPFTAGAFLSWKLYPAIKVSLDGRFEVAYPPGLLAEHLDFYHGAPNWRAIRDAYPSDLILTRRAWESARLLRAEGRWPIVYEDDGFMLFARPGLELPRRDRRGTRFVGSFP